MKRGGSLSFLMIFTFAVPELLDLIWRKIGFLPYVMITWVVFLRMFWNFISSLLVKRGGSLSFLTIFTFAVPELLDLIWRKIGFLPYVVCTIFQLYHGDQFTKPGANPRCIGDRLVWAVRSNDLTHWTTRDLFFPFFVVCFCLITLCIIIYCLFLITGTLCIFCCNLNLNFWCFMPLSAIFHLYHGDQFLGVALVYYMFILDYIVYWL